MKGPARALILNKATILLIENKRTDRPFFADGIQKKGYIVKVARNGSGALSYLAESKADLVVVNAASLRTSGRRICQTIRQQLPKMPIVLVAEENGDPLAEVDANVVLYLPFTLQKLINRIRPLLPVADSRDLVKVGELQLDVKQRIARCNDRQAKLTPRLTRILHVLMEHPGVAIEREELFKKVWDTSYTADMRSLDVHISWLRYAIEEDARRPRLIKTIRGVGYRLDVGELPTRPLNRRKLSET